MIQRFTLLFALLFALSFTTASAQDDNKSNYLPQAGDIGLGFDAVPFLEFVGNSFNNTTGNTVGTDFVDGQTIVGKYFTSENTAWRGIVRIGARSLTAERAVTNDNKPDETVVDELSQSEVDVSLGAGYEWRRGYGRLQGYYGAEVAFQLITRSNEYEYGNDLDDGGTTFNFDNVNDFEFTSGDELNVSVPTNIGGLGGARTVEFDPGTIFGANLRGFVGVEYFILPKMSLGGEFGWGLTFATVGDSEVITEDLNSNLEPETTTTEAPNGSTFLLDTDNFNGNIFMNFYF